MSFVKLGAAVALILALASLSLSGCESPAESHEESHEASHSEGEHHAHDILVTSPVRMDVVNTQPYVCQIHSCKHIEVRALEGGYLQEIHVNEGQAVRKGELMFKILPVLHQAKLNTEIAEAQRLQIELENAEALFKKNIVSSREIALKTAEVAKAQAQVTLAQAELNFTSVRAPFDGIVDRQLNQLGSLIEEGDVLTTLSDNSLMWVYFNVPEARYLEYRAELDGTEQGRDREDGDHENDSADHLQIQLKLANGQLFPHPGRIGAIEADFNNTTGNIAFRGDFPNPEGLLRNGQTGTILVNTLLHDAILIPQRATFEILAKQYVFVVDAENVVHQRDITVQSEQDDIFVIKEGLDPGEHIILEGIRQVRDGDRIEAEFKAPEEVFSNLKHHAE